MAFCHVVRDGEREDGREGGTNFNMRVEGYFSSSFREKLLGMLTTVYLQYTFLYFIYIYMSICLFNCLSVCLTLRAYEFVRV